MSKVQRYDDGGYNGYGVTEDDDGEYVLYSDYADLKRQRDELAELLKDTSGALRVNGLGVIAQKVEEALAKAEKADEPV